MGSFMATFMAYFDGQYGIIALFLIHRKEVIKVVYSLT
jgi:hypothetical protein